MINTNFGLIGVSGYIAPKHLQAIKNNNGNLDACFDISDSVGILDSYFEKSKFFSNFERFERYVSKQKATENKIDYMSICSPNYLHDSHIRFSLYNGCNVICEKPIVLYPHNLDNLEKIEEETNKKVFTIFQLRKHPNVKKIIDLVKNDKDKIYNIDLTYITFRGPWYLYSWKGEEDKSGGITTNIGIHFFDLLIHIFGKCRQIIVHQHEKTKASGYLELDRAKVKWYLSIDKNDLTKNLNINTKTYRSIKIDGEEFDLSYGFNDLHDKCYKDILDGNGYKISDVRETVEMVHKIRSRKIEKNKGNKHPLFKN